MNKPLKIGVVGSGNEDSTSEQTAEDLGRRIAERGWALITGGRNAGVMKAANIGAKQAGGLTIGILPDRDTDISPNVDVAIITGTGEARNNIIVLSADVVVACGVNDPGTASEVALALKAAKPVILLAAGDAATGFFQQIGHALIHLAASPDEAIVIIESLF